MNKRKKIISKIILTLSVILIFMSVAGFIAAYMLNKQVGLPFVMLIRDLILSMVGAWTVSLITPAILFAVVGVTGLYSYKKWFD